MRTFSQTDTTAQNTTPDSPSKPCHPNRAKSIHRAIQTMRMPCPSHMYLATKRRALRRILLPPEVPKAESMFAFRALVNKKDGPMGLAPFLRPFASRAPVKKNILHTICDWHFRRFQMRFRIVCPNSSNEWNDIHPTGKRMQRSCNDCRSNVNGCIDFLTIVVSTKMHATKLEG